MAQYVEPELHETPVLGTTSEERTRIAARKRVEKRRGLQGALIAYVVVNAGLVAIWALAGGGYFWPGWVMGLWGIGMILGTWDYMRKPVTEADVDAEMHKMRSRGW
jgi:hypothetical protein